MGGLLRCVGVENVKAKLTEADVRSIRRSQKGQRALALEFGVGNDTIRDIRERITWRHIDSAEDVPSSVTSPDEEWRPVTLRPFEGLYEVSNLGRVRQAVRSIYIPQHILSQRTTPNGYQTVPFVKQKKRKSPSVHSLVAAAFIGPRPPGLQVNHIDGNKQHNWVGNLEYVTPLENAHHASRLGLLLGSSTSYRPRIFITHEGITRSISEWARHANMTRNMLKNRLYGGWSFDKAISTPRIPGHGHSWPVP